MATAQFTTVVDRGQDDPVTEAIWDDQIRDNLNQLAGAHRNLLVNGGFEVWQRGAGPFTADTAYAADRWQIAKNAFATLTVTQETATLDRGAAALKAVVTASGTIVAQVRQLIEDYKSLRGQTVSFSCRVHQSVASGARLQIADSAGTTSGATATTTGAYTTLTVTRTIDAAATSILVAVDFTAAGTYYLDNAMLVIGPAPAPFQPLHPQEELARCQRYYEVHGGVNTTYVVRGVATAAGQEFGLTRQFAVAKGGIPTLTKAGTWGVANCAQPTVQNPDTMSYEIKAVSSAAGPCNFFCNSADDLIIAEWNP